MKRKLSKKLIVERVGRGYKQIKVNGKTYKRSNSTSCCPMFILDDLGIVLKIDDTMNQVTKSIIRWEEWIKHTRFRKYFLPILADGKVRKGQGKRWLVQEHVRLLHRARRPIKQEIRKVVEHFGLRDVWADWGCRNWAVLTEENNRPIIYDWAI